MSEDNPLTRTGMQKPDMESNKDDFDKFISILSDPDFLYESLSRAFYPVVNEFGFYRLDMKEGSNASPGMVGQSPETSRE